MSPLTGNTIPPLPPSIPPSSGLLFLAITNMDPHTTVSSLWGLTWLGPPSGELDKSLLPTTFADAATYEVCELLPLGWICGRSMYGGRVVLLDYLSSLFPVVICYGYCVVYS